MIMRKKHLKKEDRTTKEGKKKKSVLTLKVMKGKV